MQKEVIMPEITSTLTLGFYDLYEERHPLPDDVQGYIFGEK